MNHDEQPKTCPACSNPLQVRQAQGVTIEQCPRCRGMWFDRNEFEQLLPEAARGLRVHGKTQPSTRPCPNDREMLATLIYPQTFVEVEVCPVCDGLWLDKAEVNEIKHVRAHLGTRDELDPFAPVPGLKGQLIDFVNATLAELIKPID